MPRTVCRILCFYSRQSSWQDYGTAISPHFALKQIYTLFGFRQSFSIYFRRNNSFSSTISQKRKAQITKHHIVMLLFFNTGQKKHTAMPAPATPPRQNAYYGKTKCAFRLNDNAYCLNEMRTLFPRRQDTVKTRGGTCAFPCGNSAIRSRAGMKKASLPQGKDAVRIMQSMF